MFAFLIKQGHNKRGIASLCKLGEIYTLGARLEMEMRSRWVWAGLLCIATASAETNEVSRAFMRAMAASMSRMDRGMAAAPMNGNIDHDFATMMIPHHRGAIDMAKAELSYGKDLVMRRLAQEIIVDQASETDAMNLWLKKNASLAARKK